MGCILKIPSQICNILQFHNANLGNMLLTFTKGHIQKIELMLGIMKKLKVFEYQCPPDKLRKFCVLGLQHELLTQLHFTNSLG